MSCRLIEAVRSDVTWAVCVAVGVLWATAGGAARGEIPQVESATLQVEFDAEVIKHLERTRVGFYEKYGRHNPAWDQDVKEFLREVAGFYKSALRGYDEPDTQPLWEMGRKVLEQGCDDPMVRYAVLMIEYEQHPGMEPRLMNEIPGLAVAIEQQGYPAITLNRAYWNLWIQLRENDRPEAAERAREDQLAALERSLSDSSFEGASPRVVYWQFVRSAFVDDDEPSYKPVAELLDRAFEAEHIEPWLYHSLSGEQRTEMAWFVRGNGFAHTVDNEDWPTFREYLREAEQHLIQAWEANPQYPEPATEMIGVQMGLGGNAPPRMRKWFDRAVSAQFDYLPAYNSYRWGMRSRWHGGPEELYQFGLECAATERYDTNVPFEFMYALINAGADSLNYVAFMEEPRVYEAAKPVFEAYRDSEYNPGTSYDLLSFQLALAFHAKQWEEVTQLYSRLGEQELDSNTLYRFRLHKDEIMPIAEARISPLAEQIESEIDKARNGEIDASIAGLEAIIEQGLESENVRRYVADHLVGLRWRKAFDAGATINLLVHRSLDGWRLLRGRWWFDGQGRLVGLSTGAGYADQLAAVVGVRFGNRWRLRGRVTIWEHLHRRPSTYPAILLSYIENEHRDAPSIVLDERRGQVQVRPLGYRKRSSITVNAPIIDDHKWPYRFEITNDAGRLTVVINGETILDGVQTHVTDPMGLIGIGGAMWWTGDHLAFDELELEKIEPGEGARPAPDAPDAPDNESAPDQQDTDDNAPEFSNRGPSSATGDNAST